MSVLQEPEPPPPPPPSKLKRSRNGCAECRRLHRRCDEEKPVCANCRTAGKVCRYERPLSWGGRPFGRSSFRHVLRGGGVVEIPAAVTENDAPFSRSFVYGQPAGSGSGSSDADSILDAGLRNAAGELIIQQQQPGAGISTVEFSDTSGVLLPWLSLHHRMLFHHFIESFLPLFSGSIAEQQEIESIIVPMAVDTNHGFSLLAAIISLASTHRMHLGLHQDEHEIEYWRNMSVGHLRRPTVQEDESTENVFASTALMLAIRDAISDVTSHSAWRMHAEGALTALARLGTTTPVSLSAARNLLQRIARSLRIRAPLPPRSPESRPIDPITLSVLTGPDVLGLPGDLSAVLHHIQSLKLEKDALGQIESNSGSTEMQPLWTALHGQCLEIIVRIQFIAEDAQPNVHMDAGTKRLYCRAALIQVYSGILDLRTNDAGLRNTLDRAVAALRSLVSASEQLIAADLIYVLFIVGCLVEGPADRDMIRLALVRISRERGKRNAAAVAAFLDGLWTGADLRGTLVGQMDVEALMAEKGWDLSLW